MHTIIEWLTSNWSGGYLIGTGVGVCVHYLFRSQDRAGWNHRMEKRFQHFIIGCAGRLLLADKEKNPQYEDAIMNLTADLLCLQPHERPRLIEIMREVREEMTNG